MGKEGTSIAAFRRKRVLWALASSAVTGALGACWSEQTDNQIETTVQEVRTGAGGMVGLDVLVTDDSGNAIPCGEGKLDVSVEVASNGQGYAPVNSRDVIVQCAGTGASVALVLDNSGSEQGHLDELQVAADSMLQGVLEAGGKASFVRVSTNAQIQVPLTSDRSALVAALEGMHIGNGWTALYDGIRMGNESLGGVLSEHADVPAADTVGAFCGAAKKTGILVFTDGRENNSSDEKAANYDAARYPGDGFNTLLSDLGKLRIDAVTTPIYTIGLGRNIDESGLQSLAAQSGGRYLHADSAAQLPTLFDRVRQYLGASHQVCLDLPANQCGDFNVRVTYDWTDGKRSTKREVLETVHIPCPVAAQGKVATAVLTFSNPGISRALASDLAKQAVDYVAPSAVSPKILIVRDDAHHNEFKDDPLYIRTLLQERGYQVTFMEEPNGGLRQPDLQGFDVVWFSNPGYPMDDHRSFNMLRAFSNAGGGVVLQGDDITWSLGRGFSLTPLTQLNHVDNGTAACNVAIDNNVGGTYNVQFGEGSHPLLGGLAGQRFGYRDDIDRSTPTSAAQVVAAASFARGTCTWDSPVLVGYDPRANNGN